MSEDKLTRDIIRFRIAHRDELNDHDQFIISHAAGIVARIHGEKEIHSAEMEFLTAEDRR